MCFSQSDKCHNRSGLSTVVSRLTQSGKINLLLIVKGRTGKYNFLVGMTQHLLKPKYDFKV